MCYREEAAAPPQPSWDQKGAERPPRSVGGRDECRPRPLPRRVEDGKLQPFPLCDSAGRGRSASQVPGTLGDEVTSGSVGAECAGPEILTCCCCSIKPGSTKCRWDGGGARGAWWGHWGGCHGVERRRSVGSRADHQGANPAPFLGRCDPGSLLVCNMGMVRVEHSVLSSWSDAGGCYPHLPCCPRPNGLPAQSRFPGPRKGGPPEWEARWSGLAERWLGLKGWVAYGWVCLGESPSLGKTGRS